MTGLYGRDLITTQDWSVEELRKAIAQILTVENEEKAGVKQK